MKYVKTTEDKEREKLDLDNCPIMRYLKNKENVKFKKGDILIKQIKNYFDDEWKDETVGIGARRRYIYAFENELGVGYIKQIKVDGSGFTSRLECTANIDPSCTRLVLDPDYVDHLIVGDQELDLSQEYLRKKAYREEAMKLNKQLVMPQEDKLSWFYSLKVGDEFWFNEHNLSWAGRPSIDPNFTYKMIVTKIFEQPIAKVANASLTMSSDAFLAVKQKYRGKIREIQVSSELFPSDDFTLKDLEDGSVFLSQPHPLEDPLCGRQR